MLSSAITDVQPTTKAFLRTLAPAIACALLIPQTSHAQIVMEGVTPGITAVCSFSGVIIPATTDDCVGGTDPSAVNSTRVGPSGGGLTVSSPAGNVVVDGQTSFNKDVNMTGKRITNVGAPSAGTDAVNRDYVDALGTRVTNVETKNGEQDDRLDAVETKNGQQDGRLNLVEAKNTEQDTRLGAVETTNATQNTRLTNVESVNSTQNDRLDTVESAILDQSDQISAINRNISSLRDRDRDLADGIAISLALEQPNLLAGQTFALRAGWGNFDGSDAYGLSAAGLVNRGLFGQGSSVVVDAGVGTSTAQNMVAGRAGLTLGW